MARSISFNGVTRFRPGGITRINADALNQIGVTAGGVMGLIGEADGGAPGSESGLISLRSPAAAADLFRSGPLVDAIKLAFQSSGDPLIPGGAAEVVVYKTNQSTKSSVHLPDLGSNLVSTTATAGSTTTSVNVATTLVTDALIGRWALITLSALPGALTFLRKIVDNTTSAIVVSPALPAAPSTGDTVLVKNTLAIVESRDYGAHTASIEVNVDYNSSDESYQVYTQFDGEEQLSPSLGGQSRNYLHVVYRGGSLADSTLVVAGSTVSTINVTPASLVSAAHNNQTLVLKDPSGNVKAITKVASNGTGDITLAVSLSAVPSVGDIVELYAVTDAVASFTGSNGAATSFTSTITGVSGDNLSIAITAGMTVRQLASLINANPNYLATVPPGINGDVELASQFDFGTGTSINIQRSFTGTTSLLGFRQDVKEIVEWINEQSIHLTAQRCTIASGDGADGNTADYPGSTGDPLPFMFRLAGGSRGTSANSDFQAGFDAMLLRVVDEVVPLIDQDLVNEGNGSTATWSSVAAQLVDHVTAARGASGLERGGWIGFRGTKAEIIAAANSCNDMDVALTCQSPTIVGSSGSLVQAGPREMAVMGASMRLGVSEIGEPLTNKFLRVSALTQDNSWNPSDITDSGDLIQNGVMFAENVPGVGTKWVRDLTTWVRDDNLAYSEGSVRDVVRYVAYNLRTTLDRRFTGRRASPATIASVRDVATALLETFRTQNIIVDSTDPATGATIRAYHNLKVTSSGDVVRLNVGIFPVPGINFELTDIYLSLPTQSA